MSYRRLFIIRKDLNMSPGKLSAQVSHCAEAYWTNLIKENCNAIVTFSDEGKHSVEYKINFEIDQELYEQYVCGTFTKTVCEAKNKNHLLKAKDKALSMGLEEGKDFGLIYDNCYTELAPEEENGTTLTGIWFGPLPDETAHEISKKYQLYKGV